MTTNPRSRTTLKTAKSSTGAAATQVVTASPSAETNTGTTTPAPSAKLGKLDKLIDLLRRPVGASLPELMTVSGWQAHSVRGAIAAAIPKKLGTKVVSEKQDSVRRYRLPAAQ